jgi:hypothetical protein
LFHFAVNTVYFKIYEERNFNVKIKQFLEKPAIPDRKIGPPDINIGNSAEYPSGAPFGLPGHQTGPKIFAYLILFSLLCRSILSDQ